MQVCCCLCWAEYGVRTSAPAIRGWEGIPLCREHLAQGIARTSGEPKRDIAPNVAAPAALQ
jgi:hypothetical protein